MIFIFYALDSVGYLTEKKHSRYHLFPGPRFPPVGHASDRAYLLKMKEVAKKHNFDLREGVYCGLGISNCFLLMFLVEISTYFNFFQM